MPHQDIPHDFQAIFFSWFSVSGGHAELAKYVEIEPLAKSPDRNPLLDVYREGLSLQARGRLQLVLYAREDYSSEQEQEVKRITSATFTYLKDLDYAKETKGNELIWPSGEPKDTHGLLVEVNWKPKNFDIEQINQLESPCTSNKGGMKEKILVKDIVGTLEGEDLSSSDSLRKIAKAVFRKCEFLGMADQAELLHDMLRCTAGPARELYTKLLSPDEVSFHKASFLESQQEQHQRLDSQDDQLATFLSTSFQNAGGDVRAQAIQDMPQAVRGEIESCIHQAKINDYKKLIFQRGKETVAGLNKWLQEMHGTLNKAPKKVENEEKAFYVNAIQHYVSKWNLVLIDTRDDRECTATTVKQGGSVRYILQSIGGKNQPWKSVKFPPVRAIKKIRKK